MYIVEHQHLQQSVAKVSGLQPNTITLSGCRSVGELRPRAAQHGHSLNRIRHPVIKVTNFMNIISIIFRGTRSSLNLTRDYNKSKLG